MRKWVTGLLAAGLLVGMLGASVSASPDSRNFTVVFQAERLPADAEAIIARVGGTVLTRVDELGLMRISAPPSAMQRLNAHREILAATPTLLWERDPVQTLAASEIGEETVNPAAADLYQAYQWDIKQVTAEGASWGLSTGSHQTVVGIIDTGVNTAHSALTANLLGGRNFVDDGPGGTVVASDIEDRDGHGSHVAGSIAGKGRILGVGPDLGFRVYRIFGADGGAPTDRIAAAIVAAVNDGVDVISMSLGGYDAIARGFWTDPFTGITYAFKDVADFAAWRRAIKYAVDNGVVVVNSAGNDTADIGNPIQLMQMVNAKYGSLGYTFLGAVKRVPSTISGVVAVSATGPDTALSSYSNFGNPVDVSAPGGDFLRYPYGDWYVDMCLSATSRSSMSVDRYAWMAGTSMAAPKAAAVAALIIDQAKANGEVLKPQEVVRRLQMSATDLGKQSTDPVYGHGMVNAYRALGGL